MTARSAAHGWPAARGSRTVFAALLAGLTVLTFAVGVAFHLTFPDSVRGGVLGGPFELVDGHGHHVTERSWPGRYLLVYFGYTHCPDACPTTLAAIAAAMSQLGRLAARVQPIFISVDPYRDTPPAMAAYAAAFSPRLVGLTGTDQQVAFVAREYGVFFSDFGEMHATDYTVDHGHDIYLMAPAGHFLTAITSRADPRAIARAIRGQLPRS